ncbi:MAG: methyltransferase domain-containing protein [Flavobacteriales bacterium]|nr:methyltransferase domain-containing protein [Flavobacteriales bacterium]
MDSRRYVVISVVRPTGPKRSTGPSAGRRPSRMKHIDATAIPKPDASFDVVIFKSMIGALSTKEKQAQAIREMHRVLKRGGVLLFAENLQGTRLHTWLRKRFVAWDHYWRYLDPVKDRDLFVPFARLDDHTTGLLANLGRSEGQRDVLARFDAVVSPLVPPTQRTIWFGVAVKD